MLQFQLITAPPPHERPGLSWTPQGWGLQSFHWTLLCCPPWTSVSLWRPRAGAHNGSLSTCLAGGADLCAQSLMEIYIHHVNAHQQSCKAVLIQVCVVFNTSVQNAACFMMVWFVFKIFYRFALQPHFSMEWFSVVIMELLQICTSAFAPFDSFLLPPLLLFLLMAAEAVSLNRIFLSARLHDLNLLV